jgi:HD-GYP domain-containing protein (c-di-GMP phosphodiesterase class II)
MTADRPYREAMPGDEALEEVTSGAGTQFDPAVVEALSDVVGASG